MVKEKETPGPCPKHTPRLREEVSTETRASYGILGQRRADFPSSSFSLGKV